MGEPIKVSNSKLLLVIVIIVYVFIVPFFILSTISAVQNRDMELLLIALLVCGGMALICLPILVTTLRRKLLLYENYAAYTPTLGKTRTFTYTEIRSITPRGSQYVIYGYDGTKLAILDCDMPAFSAAIAYLQAKHVTVESPKLLVLLKKIIGFDRPALSEQETDMQKKENQLHIAQTILLLISAATIFLLIYWITIHIF